MVWLNHPLIENLLVSDSGEFRNETTGDLLKQHPRRHGYLYVNHNGKRVTAHKAVLETFVCIQPDGKECRHLNGINTDNRLENLAWGTKRENEDDKMVHGTKTQGVLSVDDVKRIREMRQQGLSILEIADILGVRWGVVQGVYYNKTYKWV